MHEDFLWFKEHYKEFQEKYGTCVLAIKNKQILGVYDSVGEANKQTLKTEENGTFSIQEVHKDYEAYVCIISSMNFA